MTINPKRVTRLGTKKLSNIATSSQRAADARRIKDALMGGFRKPRTAIVGDGNGNVDAVAISGAPNTIYFKYPSDVTDEQRWAYVDWAQNDERFVHGTVILVEPSHENPREMVVRGYDPLRTKFQHEVRPNFRAPSAAFTHTFDFEVAHECWVPNNSATHYVPANGWDVTSGDTLYLKKMGFESFILTSIQTVWQNAWASFPGAGGGVFIYDQDGTLLGSEDAFPIAGVDISINNYEVTGIKVQAVRTGPGTESGLVDAYLSSIIISGIGINPFEDEVCPDTLPIQSLTGVATTGQLPSDIVYLAQTQTLTNKTLTSPVINGGTANSLVIGGTTPAAGRFTALALNTSSELTISGGAITVNQTRHTVDTESDDATDDLVTINGGSNALNRLMIRAESTSRTVVIKRTGNITTPDDADITLDDTNKVIDLVYDSGLLKWQVVGVSGTSGGGGSIGVSDGSTSVNPADSVVFDPAYFDISDAGGGTANVSLHTPGGTMMRVEVPIFETELSVAAGSISISGIAQDGEELIYYLMAKTTDTSATSRVVNAYFNGDTIASNYLRQNIAGLNDAATAGELNNATIPALPGSNASNLSNSFAYIRGVIPQYANTAIRKFAQVEHGSIHELGAATVGRAIVGWIKASNASDAITDLSFVPSAGNFEVGTRIVLYKVIQLSVGGGAITDMPPSHCDFRLTLESGVAVSTSDQSAKSTLYLTPYKGSVISLYDGSAWAGYTAAELSLSLAGLDRHRLYDIWCYLNAGSPALDYTAWVAPTTGTITGVTNASPPVVTSVAHGLAVGDIVTIHDVGGATGANDTFRVSAVGTVDTFTVQTLAAANPAAPGVYTGGGTWVKKYSSTSRATAITYQNGVPVKTGDATRRYVGTIAINATGGQTDDTTAARLVDGIDHPKPKTVLITDSTDSWSYAVSAWRAARDSYLNRVDFVIGLDTRILHLETSVYSSTASSSGGSVGVGLDSVSSNSAQIVESISSSSERNIKSVYRGMSASAGLHFAQWIENRRAGTVTYYGDFGIPTYFQSGLIGAIS